LNNWTTRIKLRKTNGIELERNTLVAEDNHINPISAGVLENQDMLGGPL